MDRSLFFNKLSLLCVLVSATTLINAQDETKTIAEQAKQKAKDGLHWYIERSDAMKKEWQDAYERGKIKAEATAQNVKVRAKSAWERARSTDVQTQHEVKSSEVVDTQLPLEISTESITPAEPVSRTVITITEKEIDGVKHIASVEIQQQQSWIAWLKTEEGQRFGKGALAVITIAGATYVLYKNRVPQRVYGYVVHNPFESFILGACAVCLAAYIAQVNNITLDSVKNTFCIPSSTI